MDIAIVLGLLVVTIVLFAWEKYSVDVITLAAIVVLVLVGIIKPEEAFEGFSSEFIIMLGSIFVLSGALRETGVLEIFGATLTSKISGSASVLNAWLMGVVGFFSAFMNNTTVTALFVGPTMTIAKKLSVPPSKLLMSIAYASMLGGTCTLIGTSTNIAISGEIAKRGMEPVGMFEILPIGLAILGVGIVFMSLIGHRLLPKNRSAVDAGDLDKRYFTEVVIPEGSPFIGQALGNTPLADETIEAVKVMRGRVSFAPLSVTKLVAGDHILIESNMEHLLHIKETDGVNILADLKELGNLDQDNIKLAELMINDQSDLLGSSIKSSKFRLRFGVAVLGIERRNEVLRKSIKDIPLRFGDVLLVQGAAETLSNLRGSSEVTVLEEFKPILFRKRRGMIVLGLFLAAIVLGSFKVVPFSIAFLAAALLAVACKTIPIEKAHQSIDWRLLILIGGMSAFGVALANTKADVFLAMHLVDWLAPYGELTIMAGIMVLTVLLTQPMSNAAAALVVLPVAIEIANSLQVNPRSFAIAVMLSASASLVTPFEPACILVHGPGKYRFSDFLKVGSLATLLIIAVVVALIPVFWPLNP